MTSDLVTVRVAAQRTGIPERTIRAWAKPTTDRAALLQKSGHLVSLSALDRVCKETKYQPRQREKPSRTMTAAEFAKRVGRTKSTVYGWRKDGVINDYSERECKRIIIALERKEKGGHGLEEQGHAHQAAVERGDPGELGGGIEGIATPGQLRYERLLAQRRDNALAAGKLYEASAAESVVRNLARVYRESVDRLAVEIPRIVAAECDRAGVQLDPHLRASIASAVQAATLAEAPVVEHEVGVLKSKTQGRVRERTA